MAWTDYHDATEGRPPQPLLLQALDGWRNEPGHGIDLGCGSGRDTLELLRRGWRVLALDADGSALVRTRAQIQASWQSRLETRACRFEDAVLPRCELIHSSFALPFCEPAAFPRVWKAIEASLAPGGVFCGQLIGPADSWAAQGVTVHERHQVDAMLASWKVLHFEETRRDGVTALGKHKHWHLYWIIARKPSAAD